ncbi:uncharacterized protein si:ch211-67e16.3 [Electrophorus electricus]|uniref:uncharacterized protein si:ch211-67e16.3 n=1 Tax=Electrophorus electricus TaxID=8005 RepID=UPI0015D037C3|nr:uncharacterized protein si:ch211-67e16.3 [Electrophorus electricus]XP_035379502.1 uncharacterized protein si:ch211-67e16.3 [Electrophorus electricus]XP_035379503.1 uncharacterized protein si:ch211-67e16.3 [Electrophorus electricus]
MAAFQPSLPHTYTHLHTHTQDVLNHGDMSHKFFILVLSLSFELQDVCSELCVNTHQQYSVDNIFWPNITCQHDGKTEWKVQARLIEKRIICDMRSRQTCDLSQDGNQFKFTLKNTTSTPKSSVYICEVYRSSPAPVIIRESEELTLNSGCHVPDTQATDPGNACLSHGFFSLPVRVTWALIGLAILLCLYSLTVTILYVRLRIKMSEDLYDTLTYVPMQRNVRCQVPDKNAEYMDMRVVQLQPGSSRDTSHNSHHHSPVGFTK